MDKFNTETKLDLNIGEKYLSSWPEYFAIREIIANAIDESYGKPAKINKIKDGIWCIEDRGSGIKKGSFIFQEGEKSISQSKIGKFGAGLKDALGVLYSRGMKVEIFSGYYKINFQYEPKSGVENIKTLHANVNKIEDKFDGTKFIIKNCNDKIIEDAKNQFLCYKDIIPLEENDFGQIFYECNSDDNGSVYLNGLKISKESKFKYSYNIINAKSIKDKINRERNYINQNVYRRKIIDIIKNVQSREVITGYFEEIKISINGIKFDEISWVDTIVRTCNYYIENNKRIVIITNEDVEHYKEYYNRVKQIENIVIVKVPIKIKNKLINRSHDLISKEIFLFNINIPIDKVKKEDLNENEKQILEKTIQILKTILGVNENFLNRIEFTETYSIPINQSKEDICIPRYSLVSIRECGVAIVNVLSSITNEGDNFKNYVLGSLFDKISERE